MPAFNPRGVGRGSTVLCGSNHSASGHHAISRRSQPNENPDAGPGWAERNCEAMKDMFCVPLNALSIFIPLGIGAGTYECSSLIVFSLNFLAIIPLAGVMGVSTEALAAHTGQMFGGLLNATFGNAVEVLVTISAIRAGLVTVVQDSLIGSILSNLLLVLGMAFIASGVVHKEAAFNITGAAANITCLVLASISMTLPTCFSYVKHTTEEEGVSLSRMSAAVLTFVYIMFLVFQLRTHSELFVGEDEEEEEQNMSCGVAMSILFGSTCAVAFCSNYLVDSIEGLSVQYGVPKTFIGMILLPIVGNAAEHTTAVSAAYKGKMDLALGVAVGSATQIALFVVPFSVLVGWCVDVPMTLDFQLFSCTVFLLSVFIASSVMTDGHANWFEGTMLCASYTIVAILTWYLPDRGTALEAHDLKRLLTIDVNGVPMQPLI